MKNKKIIFIASALVIAYFLIKNDSKASGITGGMIDEKIRRAIETGDRTIR